MIGDQSDIFNRLKGMLPSRWFGTASDPVPLIDAVLSGFATSLAFLYSLYLYAKLQTRINTATDGWLDLIAADFFGPAALQRKTGQSDSSYRNAIKVALLREKATRNAIINTLVSLTGRTPIIVEPQRPADTGAYGFNPAALLVGASIFRSDWQGNQLLFSTPRSNLLLHSQDTSAGTATRGTASNAATAGADGGQAIQFVETTAAGGHHFAVAAGTLAAGSYAFSLQIRPNGRNYFQIQFLGNIASINLDLSSTGAIAAKAGSVSNVSVVQISNGTFLLKATVSVGTTGSVVPVDVFSTIDSTFALSYTGDGASGFYVRFHMESATVAGAYITTTTSATTVTDYALSSTGRVTTASPPLPAAAMTAISASDGFTTPQPLGVGDGYTNNFAMTIPTGPYAPIGYGVAGSYGSLVLPYQAFVTAFRPISNIGIANVAGYGISTGGYSQPSQAEYASMSMVSGGVTDGDIFAAIDAVKPAGTIVWTRISN